jgi:hypothetical protein
MISERTAKRHVTAILTKLRLESRLQAGITALITPAPVGTATARPDGHLGPCHLGPCHLGACHLGPCHLGPCHLGPCHLGACHLGPRPPEDPAHERLVSRA